MDLMAFNCIHFEVSPICEIFCQVSVSTKINCMKEYELNYINLSNNMFQFLMETAHPS